MIVSLWSDISLFQFVLRKCGLDLKCRLLNNEGWSLYICLSRGKKTNVLSLLYSPAFFVFHPVVFKLVFKLYVKKFSLELYENGKKK